MHSPASRTQSPYLLEPHEQGRAQGRKVKEAAGRPNEMLEEESETKHSGFGVQ